MAFLTGPTRTLADFQVEYGGLLLGAGTPFDLPSTWTFLDSPPVKSQDVSRQWGDGSYSGPDFAETATWQLPVEIAPDAGVSFTDALVQFRQVIAIAPAARPLWVKLPGLPVQGIAAKVTQRSLPIDLGFGKYVDGAVQWRAPDPVWQSLPRTVPLAASSGGGGLNYPLHATYSGSGTAMDYGIATAGAYASVLTNAGNTDACPVAVVVGPTPGFQLTLNGRIVAYSDTLAATDTVTVDWRTGRAYLSVSGSTPVDRTHLLTARDFGAVPAAGTATVTFAGGAGATAAVTTADLWR